MSWIPLVLLSSFVTAFNNILDKRLVNGQDSPPPLVCATSFGVVGLPVAIVGLILLSPIAWLPASTAVIAGAIFTGAVWLYYDTISLKEDISRLTPLLQLSSVYKLLLAVIFLGEMLARQQLAAFGIMVISGIILSLKVNGGRLTFSRAVLRMIPVTILLAINGVLMADVYRITSIWHGLVWEDIGTIAALIVMWAIAWRRQNHFWRGVTRRTWGILIWEQIVRKGSGLVPAHAIAGGVPVALLSALGGARLVWVWLLAVLVLHEQVTRKGLLLKGSGIFGMIVGIYLLV